MRVVFMGVAGCGKSSLAAAVAEDCGLVLVEGDAHHSDANRAKMNRGQALTDEDRRDWLATLAGQLAAHESIALTCSALKRSYRDRLRSAAPDLRFVFMHIGREDAERRVAVRSQHFFSPTLVQSQFETLEPPLDEDGVLTVDATAPLPELRAQVARWLG